MDCKRFEELISEYLDGTLEPARRVKCATHVIQCRACRALADDVRAALAVCHRASLVEPPPDLNQRILQTTAAGQMMSCTVFDELIVDYFDGFITASEFHLFEQHFETCPRCKRLLGSIEMARELCREVQAVPAPEDLNEKILAATAGREPLDQPAPQKAVQRLLGQWSWDWRHIWRGVLAPELMTAALLCLATVGLLLVDFSDDHSLSGVVRQATHRVEQVLSQSDKEKLAANVKEMKARVGSVIQTGLMFLLSEPAPQNQKPGPDRQVKPPPDPPNVEPKQPEDEKSKSESP
jgi:anti-sigma factor RsiW